MTNLARTFNADDAAVAEELERHRPGLTAHCYRMLGSAFEAEDALQETFIRAWRGFDRFEGRAELRSWLFRIATNVCLDLLNGRARRALPMNLAPPSSGDSDLGPSVDDSAWVTPIPDRLVIAPELDPAESVATRDSVRLAFVAALQHLQPKPRAVLLLRDVLGWHADEVAEALDTTVTAVHSMLRRARSTMAERDASRDHRPAFGESEWELVDRYVDAFQRFDIDALVALLRDDAAMSMPPIPGWLRGAPAIAQFWRGRGSDCRGSRILRTRANGLPAFGSYRPVLDGSYQPFAIQVIDIADGRITGLHAFLEPRLFPLFALPEHLARPRSTHPTRRPGIRPARGEDGR